MIDVIYHHVLVNCGGQLKIGSQQESNVKRAETT